MKIFHFSFEIFFFFKINFIISGVSFFNIVKTKTFTNKMKKPEFRENIISPFII